MKITFYFVRHGETRFNEKGRVQGVCDSPLTALGKAQADRAGDALREVYFDQAFTSPAERAMQTARHILSGRNMEAVIVEDLHEFDFGRYEGTRFTSHPDELKQHFATRDFSSAEGESPARMEVRVREVMKDIVSRCEDQDRVLIVSHGMFELFLMTTLLNVDGDSFYQQRVAEGRRSTPNGGIMVFTYEDGEYRMTVEPTEAERFVLPEEEKHVVFYYVRHGETRFNMWNRMQGADDSPLTAAGIHQAEEARDALRGVEFNAVYTSPYGRARKTAQIIAAPHRIEPVLEKGLKEVDFGDFEGVVTDSWRDEIMRRHLNEQWDDVGGENLKQVQERIRKTLHKIIRKAKDNDTILLVSHGTYYLNILKYLFDIDRTDYFEKRMKAGRQAMPNGGIFTFEYTDGVFRIRELMVSPDEYSK
ncbi:MAG: histidine phosphatase family protein [Solobacterium sp.]|nr:histidine phosphatase family protein [Solobacterium sp.]